MLSARRPMSPLPQLSTSWRIRDCTHRPEDPEDFSRWAERRKFNDTVDQDPRMDEDLVARWKADTQDAASLDGQAEKLQGEAMKEDRGAIGNRTEGDKAAARAQDHRDEMPALAMNGPPLKTRPGSTRPRERTGRRDSTPRMGHRRPPCRIRRLPARQSRPDSSRRPRTCPRQPGKPTPSRPSGPDPATRPRPAKPHPGKVTSSQGEAAETTMKRPAPKGTRRFVRRELCATACPDAALSRDERQMGSSGSDPGIYVQTLYMSHNPPPSSIKHAHLI